MRNSVGPRRKIGWMRRRRRGFRVVPLCVCCKRRELRADVYFQLPIGVVCVYWRIFFVVLAWAQSVNSSFVRARFEVSMCVLLCFAVG